MASDNESAWVSDGDSAGELKRKIIRRAAIAAAVVVVALLLCSTAVFVDETEYVIVERLGTIVAVYDLPDDRGLRFKAPWPVDMVRRFDRRVQLFDPRGREIFSRDRKNIVVDSYVCWKIAEPEAGGAGTLAERPVVRFFRGLGSREVAEARLDTRVRSILATRIGQEDLSDLLNVWDSESGPDADEIGRLETIADSVQRLVSKQPEETQSLKERLGIEIVDVRIKRINLPTGNQQAVFERMRSERRKIAEGYRSDGMAENLRIKSQADRQYNEILSKARADAERIRGEAEAKAVATLNRAHARDPEFYRVMQTLDTYKKILNDRTTLVLSASSKLLKMLTEGIPEDLAAPPSAEESPLLEDKGAGEGDGVTR